MSSPIISPWLWEVDTKILIIRFEEDPLVLGGFNFFKCTWHIPRKSQWAIMCPFESLIGLNEINHIQYTWKYCMEITIKHHQCYFYPFRSSRVIPSLLVPFWWYLVKYRLNSLVVDGCCSPPPHSTDHIIIEQSQRVLCGVLL